MLLVYQKILSSEFAERRFDPRRRFTGQMPDFKGIYQEGCYVSPHYRISRFEFSKNTNNQAKKLPDDFPRFSFSKILKDSKQCEQIYSTTGALQQQPNDSLVSSPTI